MRRPGSPELRKNTRLDPLFHAMGFTDFLRQLFGGRGADQRPREAVGPARPRRTPRPRTPGTDAGPDEARLAASRLPVLRDDAELAQALGLTGAELRWLTDPHRRVAGTKPHYRLLVRQKKRGIRVLLAPRPRLLRAQRWILRHLLRPLAPHPAAHGFTVGRNILTNAAPHVNREVVVRLDVENFFHQFTYRDVVGLFRALGYGLQVARSLALLTTAPQREMIHGLAERAGLDAHLIEAVTRQSRRGTRHPMLPQGAPTSPALANLLCMRLDWRLAGLARRFGATYTRYADDLTFSGGPQFRRDLRRFVPLVREILRREHLVQSPAKLHFARKGAHQRVTGIVVNAKPNTPARDYRSLRAILHNCAQTGPAAQNRGEHPHFREHLLGRIAHHAQVNPERGRVLRKRFEQIAW